jgi:hypothetical protein
LKLREHEEEDLSLLSLTLQVQMQMQLVSPARAVGAASCSPYESCYGDHFGGLDCSFPFAADHSIAALHGEFGLDWHDQRCAREKCW